MVKMKKAIIANLGTKGLNVSAMKIRGYNKASGEIKSITITVDDYDIGQNSAYIINNSLGEIEDEFGVMFKAKYLDL
jgi:hypothetical protein